MSQDKPVDTLLADFNAIAQKATAFDVLHRQYTAIYLALNEVRPVKLGDSINPDWVCVRLKGLALLLDNPPAQYAALAGGATVVPIAELPVLIDSIKLSLEAAEDNLLKVLPDCKSHSHESACLRLAEAQIQSARRTLTNALRFEALAEESAALARYAETIEKLSALLAQSKPKKEVQ